MCLLALSWQQHPHYPMLLAANRDESLQRPTRPACFWPEQPNLLGGKDLEAGGSWLLASKEGRWATLTNFRDGRDLTPGKISRGELVLQALQQPLEDLPSWLEEKQQDFAGFNLLWGNSHQAWYFSNRLATTARLLTPGLYILSNATLDTDWPKTQRLRRKVEEWLATDNCHPSQLFATLEDQARADDKDLPNTHVGIQIERQLSPIFISAEGYGTRTSTLLWQEASGDWNLHEKNHSTDQNLSNEQHFKWQGS